MTRACRHRSDRAFALPLILLIGLVAGASMAILLTRAAQTSRAAQVQIDGYRQHHTQAGIRVMSEVWSQFFKRAPEREGPGAVLGYDITLSDGPRMQVRFIDAQGPLRLDVSDMPVDVANVLNEASRRIRGGVSPSAASRLIRDRGPGRVSLNSASVEVLEALAEAAGGSGAGFSSAVLNKRATGYIQPTDVRAIVAASGLAGPEADRLEQCVTASPQLWVLTATIRSAAGEIVDRQGGLVLGTVRMAAQAPGTGLGDAPTPASALASASSSLATWSVLTWSAFPKGSSEPTIEELWPLIGL